MQEIRMCWAISAALKARCDMPAGHPGDHSISVTWNDDQCWNPVVDTPIPLVPVEQAKVIPLAQEVLRCVACNHQHKDGACKCGCYEFVG